MIKKLLIPFIKVLVSLTLIGLLLTKLGLRQVTTQLAVANLWWIAVATSLFVLSNLFGSVQWFWLLRTQGIVIPFRRVVAYYHVGLFFNNFLIGYVGGDAIRIFDIARHSGNSSHAISTVLMDRLIGFVMLTTLALVAGLVWHNIFQSDTILMVLGAILCCWIFSFVVLFNEKFARRIGWIFRLTLPVRIKNKMKQLYVSIHAFKNERKILLQLLLISVVVQTLRILVHYFAALAVGIHAHLKYFFIFVPAIALLSSLPISIGGIGIRETSGVALFSQINSIPAEAIVAMEFLSYLIGLIATIPGGLIFMLRPEKIPSNNGAQP